MGFGFVIMILLGIVIGLGIIVFYNENSVIFLIFMGMFDVILVGILVYMVLVDFIVVDFFSKWM